MTVNNSVNKIKESEHCSPAMPAYGFFQAFQGFVLLCEAHQRREAIGQAVRFIRNDH